jgi:hypothetical protein
VVAELVKAGASVDQADAKGYTPLMVASVGGFKDVSNLNRLFFSCSPLV